MALDPDKLLAFKPWHQRKEAKANVISEKLTENVVTDAQPDA